MNELPSTLTGLQVALQVGHLSHREAIEAQCSRLPLLNAQNHCVVERLSCVSDGPVAGELAGVGLAHKDIFNLVGRTPGVGHSLGKATSGLAAATVIERLQRHGAQNLAALSMVEHACGAVGGAAPFDRSINPLMPSAVVGGSSSGSAVAVACGMAYGSLGTDTAGSIRIPAATCALLGLKTTHGLIPIDGVYPLAPAIDSVGILTRSASDAVQLLHAVADLDLLRPAGKESLRIKAWIPEADIHIDVATALNGFAREFGVSTRLSEWSDHVLLTKLAEMVMHVQASETHHAALLEGSASAAVQAVAGPGLLIPRDWYLAAMAGRAARASAFVRNFLGDHDVLMLPALPHPVPDVNTVSAASVNFDVKQLLGLHRYMGFVNYLGCPAMVIPIAKDARGMPISAQFVAKPFHERKLLAFAAMVESVGFGLHGFTKQFYN